MARKINLPDSVRFGKDIFVRGRPSSTDGFVRLTLFRFPLASMTKLPATLRLLAALALAAALACAPPAPADSPSGTLYSSFPAIEAALLEAANRARAEAGLRPLEADERLAGAALAYSRELAARGDLSHTSATPGRETVDARLLASGGSYAGGGENLAAMSSADAPTPAEIAARVAAGWAESPAHRVNLLKPEYVLAGTGVARGEDGGWYIVQLYAAPRAGARVICIPAPGRRCPGRRAGTGWAHPIVGSERTLYHMVDNRKRPLDILPHG